MTKSIRIVLVEPSHPGNVGAVARAMKTMGFSRLYLVKPQRFPDQEALVRAGRAVNVLESVVICQTLEEAISDCQLSFATSARDRALDWPRMLPEQAALKAREVVSLVNGEVAFVFGRERVGLTNEELQQCQVHINIPTNPDYSSLNLASAVQIIVYTLHRHFIDPAECQVQSETSRLKAPLATNLELSSFYSHLEKVLISIHFLDPQVPKHLMSRMRRLFTKARLEVQELNMLRGMLTAIQKKLTFHRT